jgi:DNA-binding GntR family transcriptional regulator
MTKPQDELAALVDAVVLDRYSPVPLYFQAALAFENAITSGKVPPGTRLDNELLLAEQLGLSRPTVRRAMQYLVDKGLIVRRRGVGTRVVQPKVRRSLQLTSLYDDLQTGHQTPTTVVLSFGTVAASPVVADALAIQDGAPVLRIERLRSAQGLPIAKMTNFVPDGLIDATAEQLASTGLYRLLRSAGIVLHSASQTIGARNATPSEARLLDERNGAALVTMTRVAYDDHGLAVEYGTHAYAASRYSFEMNLLSP